MLLALISGLLAGEGKADSADAKKVERKGGGGWREFLHFTAVELPSSLALPFLTGLLVAVLVGAFFEPGFLGRYAGNAGIFLALLFAVPMYVCATASIPIAAALVAQGLGPGAAVVFLLAGPATNASTIAIVGRELGRRALGAYLGTIVIGSLLAGLLMNAWIPERVFDAILDDHGNHHSPVNMLTALILAGLMLPPLLRKVLPRRKPVKSCCEE
ncbi:MAG: permease [Planctomycetes bacterium]|nr:permease [Planctomycetota bacterium]